MQFRKIKSRSILSNKKHVILFVVEILKGVLREFTQSCDDGKIVTPRRDQEPHT